MDIVSKYLWVERYRPTELEQMILNDNFRRSFSSFITNKNMPNLMLIGIQGSGKTTIARIFIDKLISNHNDVLIFNGSADTGVDSVRTNIDDFLSIILSPDAVIANILILASLGICIDPTSGGRSILKR